jgi:type I restriction-modification system DNA methylase subunit
LRPSGAYGDVILPFTILLRRLDCILELTKELVLAEYQKVELMKVVDVDHIASGWRSGTRAAHISF